MIFCVFPLLYYDISKLHFNFIYTQQANVKYELATAQVAQGQQQTNVKYVLANQSGAGQTANVVNVVTPRYNIVSFE